MTTKISIAYPPSREAVAEMWQLLNLVESALSPTIHELEAEAIEEVVLSDDPQKDIELDEACTAAGCWLDLLRDRVIGNVTAVKHIIESGRSSAEDDDS